MDTLAKVGKFIVLSVLAANLLAWEHLLLGFDGRSIPQVNAIEIVVAFLASITIYRAFRKWVHNTLFPAMDKVFEFIENRNDKRGCECGKQHA